MAPVPKDRTGNLEAGLNFNNNKTRGSRGGALLFDGRNDRISLPDLDTDLSSGFSVSAWIRPSNASGGYQGIVGSTTASGFMMFVNEGQLAFTVDTNENGRKLVSAGSLQNSVWQLVTCTFDGSEMQWYINGQNVHSESLSGTLSDQSEAWIGWSGWSDEYFEGSIDDVRLYDNALTGQQVSSLFDMGVPSNEQTRLSLKVNLPEADSVQLGYAYPNPTTGTFGITGLWEGTKELIVSDFNGRVLTTFETDAEVPEVNLSGYPDGMYAIKVLQNGVEHTLKVIKE